MSNIIVFEPPERLRYVLRRQGEIISHFEFLAAQARRDDRLAQARALAHYSAPTLLDPFAEWWGR